jgi:5'-nucleotidase
MNSIRMWPRRIALATAITLAMATASFAQSAREDCIVRITLLQVNDVYQFAPVDRGAAGGLGRLATLRKQIIKESPNTLFLMSGDTISPSVESNTYKGAQMIDAWNAIGLDFAVFGNHEFDFGPDELLKRIKESHFTWLGANVVDTKSGKTFANTPPFVLREYQGVKLGIFGLVLPETKSTSRPGPDIDFLPACETAKKTVTEMRSAGASVIVALTHLSMSEDKALARCIEGIDVIIGGHEHTLLQSLSDRTPIFKMTSDAREMGRIELFINATNGKLQSMDWEILPVNNKVELDAQFVATMSKYDSLMKTLDVLVGRTDVPLNAKSEAGRTEETNMGNFIADAFRLETGADVAIMNGGSIRADNVMPVGELTRRDVLSILPFNNPIVKIEVTGAVLRAALEHGVSQSGGESTQPGRFPQVSGMRFAFDGKRPAGSRVTEVTVGVSPLDDKKNYTVALSSFVAGGGDGYDMFKNARMIIKPEAKLIDSEILSKAISTRDSISPKVDGRIRRIDKTTAGEQAPCNVVTKEKK